ncbi:MAG: uroporphyrinogen-III C-methyltransferase, partial [Thermodesulfobacteriota bacterium]
MVYLVGAGPGDPGLITEKGKCLLNIADVVVYDSLINTKLLNHCNKKTKFIFVGKKSSIKSITQKEINDILIKSSASNKVVVRLKGGDPLIFGRGGEEAEALTKAGILVEIVPGVSSISAVPGYSGVPLTHRKYNSSFAVITGHENPGKTRSNINWKAISSLDTLVFLMSLNNLSSIMKKLILINMPSDTPVIITSWGTLPTQNSVVGTLSDIAGKVKS